MGGDGREGERAKVNGLGRVRAQKKAEEYPIPTHPRGQKTAGGFRRYQASKNLKCPPELGFGPTYSIWVTPV